MSEADLARWTAAGAHAHRTDVRLDLTFSPRSPGDQPGDSSAWQALREIRRSLTGAIRVVVLHLDVAPFSRRLHEPPDDDQPAHPDDAELDLVQQACDWTSDPAYVSVAVLRGATVGTKLLLALGCDLRVAAGDAVLGLTEDRRQELPALGVTQSLVRAVGYSLALDLAVTGRRLSAHEAQALGLVQHVAEPDLLQSRVESLVASLLAPDRDTVREIKALLLRAEDGSRDEQRRAQRAAQLRLQARRDVATES